MHDDPQVPAGLTLLEKTEHNRLKAEYADASLRLLHGMLARIRA